MGIRFGPAGNSESFYAAGYKATEDAPAWLHAMGLTAFEYSFGRGVRLGAEKAARIAQEAEKYDIAFSVHMPYFVNLNVENEETIAKNLAYFLNSAKAAVPLGASRMVFHPGTAKGFDRNDALNTAKRNLTYIMDAMKEQGYASLVLCPETMGKISQLGDLPEVLELCLLDESMLPTIDFGHLNSRTLGGLRDKTDFAAVLDAIENTLGFERLKNMHVHFSRIEFTDAGEKKHWTFADTQYGPEFAPLAELLAERKLTPVIICESKGTMAEDALSMKRMYEAAEASSTETC